MQRFFPDGSAPLIAGVIQAAPLCFWWLDAATVHSISIIQIACGDRRRVTFHQ